MRNALLKELKRNSRFGDKRINELSDFLLAYVQQQLDSHDPDIRDFAQVQRWTALAYTQPSEAAREIASVLAGLKLEDKAEWIRMASLVETFAEPLAGFEPLMTYTRGMASLARGNTAKSVAELSQVDRHADRLEVAGVNLSIPKFILRQLSLPILENPKGLVPLNSTFYIERPPIENNCCEAILKPGALIRIKAPQEMGKTSLLLRILEYANHTGYHTVSLNLQEQVDQTILSDLNCFLRWLCTNISHQLELEPRLDEYWDEDIGSKVSCSLYLRNYVLEQIDSPLVLALDEVHQIFEHPQVAKEFLPLLRSWYEDAKRQPIWQKLRLIVLHSTEVYVPLQLNQSPFNVGLPIELPELTKPQVQDLLERHGLIWGELEVEQLMRLVGGHPYLMRVALYEIACGKMTLEKLKQVSPIEKGPYSDLLDRHLQNIEEDVRLVAAMKRVVTADSPVDVGATEAFQLRSMGLVKLRGNAVMASCDLYRQYFRDCLDVPRFRRLVSKRGNIFGKQHQKS
ncbi:AAA-like domain-containing protein [Brasilonema sp. UFV-L1]|uniref:AAA-like domain-containing protein n=1 Tax=Brasilonema sp. UFV-L1 TaxID=2234130 RepID=UPI0030DAC0C8